MAKEAIPSNYPIMRAVLEYNQIREQMKILTSRQEALKAHIQSCSRVSTAPDEKGNYLLHRDGLVFGTVRKVSYMLDTEKAEELLKAKGLWDEVIDVKEVINTDKLLALYAELKLTQDDLDSMNIEKESFSMYSGKEDLVLSDDEEPRKMGLLRRKESIPEIVESKVLSRLRRR